MKPSPSKSVADGCAPTEPTSPLTTPYAVVVDDDPIILTDVHGILEDAGFRCHEAGSGDEVKQLLARVADSVTLLF